MLKKRSKIILIGILFLIVAITMIATTTALTSLIKQEKEAQTLKGTPDFSYDIYSNENNKIMALIKVVDDEGIKEIRYPNNEMIINGNGRQTITIDYAIQEKTDYIFHITNEKGEEKDRTIRVDNLDDWIKIDIIAEKEFGTKANIDISYGQEKTKQYVIGTNNENWLPYNETFELSSYTVIDNNWGNEDGTVTIKARLLDSVGNKIQIERKISCLDLDMPKAPVITQTSALSYPVLTQYGIVIDAEAEIQYDTRSDISNYYSTDSGKTWKEYTEKISTQCVNIIAKSVKKISGLEIKQTIGLSATANDAIGKESYDKDNETYVDFRGKGPIEYFVKVLPEMAGKRITLLRSMGHYTTHGIKFYNDNNDEISNEILKGHINNLKTEYVIPEGSKKIGFYYSSSNSQDWGRIFEVEVRLSPVIQVESYYPTLNVNEVEKGHNKIKLSYLETNIKKLYKINDEEWKDYSGNEIILQIGDTIYAKGIDKNGIETDIVTYESVLPSDTLGIEAYDGDETFLVYNGQWAEYFVGINSSLQGKLLSFSGYADWYGCGETLKCYALDGSILSSKEIGLGRNVTTTFEMSIPTGTVRLGVLFRPGGASDRLGFRVNGVVNEQ